MAYRWCRGSLMVEWAISAALLLMVVTAMADASAAWRTKHILVAAAREGARVAATTTDLQVDDAQILSVVDQVLTASGVNGATRTVQFAMPAAPGTPVTVNVQVAYRPIVTGLLPASFGVAIPLQAASTMRYTGQ